MTKSTCVLMVLAAGLLCAADQAAAADGEAGAPAADQSGLSEIVVTATRREESAQRAPLTINVFTGEQLAARGIESAVDLQQVTPGLVFTLNNIFTAPFIRGVGTDITTPGAESSVATYIDGVYQQFNFVGAEALNSIERVEVLKGPQGTLYGRNATGGAISIQTRDPGSQTTGDATVDFGNYSSKKFKGYLSAPLGGGFAANIAVAISKHDGYGTNLLDGSDYGTEDFQYVRSKLLYEANDSLSFLLSAYYYHRDDNEGEAYTYFTNYGTPPATGSQVTLGSRDTYAPYPIRTDMNNFGGSLRIKADVGIGELVSLTSYQHARVLIEPDYVSTSVPVFNFDALAGGKSWIEDLYLTGSSGPWSYVAGATVVSASNTELPLNVRYGPFLGFYYLEKVNTDSYAGYGELTFKTDTPWSFTGGVRYTHERKTQDQLDVITLIPAPGVVTTPSNSRDFSNASVKLLAQYDFTHGMVYAKYETGFKSGTIEASVPFGYVPPEKIRSYEVGAKTETADRRLRLNGALFYYDYRNLQSQYTDVATGAALIQSAPKAEIYGAELGLDALLSEHLTLNLGATALGSKYKDFLSQGAFIPNSVVTGIPGTPGNSAVVTDVSGNHVVRTAPFVLNAGLQWRQPVPGGELTVSASYSYSAKFYYDVTNRIYQPGYGLLNAEVGYDIGDHWRVSIYGQNLTDKDYIQAQASNTFGDPGQLGPPRLYGAKFGFRF